MPYGGAEAFGTTCAGVVRDALNDSSRAIVLAPAARIDDVSDALGADSADVTFVATDQHARNPHRLATLLDGFTAAGEGHCVGVSAPGVSGRSAAVRQEAEFVEFLLNESPVSDWPLTLCCLYDETSSDDAGELSMRRSHAYLRGQDANDAFLPGQAGSMFATDLDPAPARAARLDVGSHELLAMRDFVRERAVSDGLDTDRTDDFVLTVNEIVTNSIRHGGGTARLAMWSADGASICEVRDDGWLRDLLAGHFAPPPSATHGRGLWLANHLCDLGAGALVAGRHRREVVHRRLRAHLAPPRRFVDCRAWRSRRGPCAPPVTRSR